MTKTKTNPKPKQTKIVGESPLLAGMVVVVFAVLLGALLYLWQESAYEIGQSEAVRETTTGTQKPAGPASEGTIKPQQKVNQNQNGAQARLQVNKNSNQAVSGEAVAELFEKAVNGKDYVKMETLVADKVYFIEEATECCGTVAKKDAIENFKNYVTETKSFNFSEDQQLVKQMKVNLVKQFGDKYVGIGNDEKVLAFHVNPQGKVDNIYLAVTHKLLDLE